MIFIIGSRKSGPLCSIRNLSRSLEILFNTCSSFSSMHISVILIDSSVELMKLTPSILNILVGEISNLS